jgi:putative photosynthetic complex assembly protein 2
LVTREFLVPLLFACLVWWASTGVILALVRVAPRSSYGWSLAALSLLLIASMGGIAAVSGSTDVGAAYISFACGVAVWAWLEFSYLTGYLTGPNKASCPPLTRPLQKFRLAIGTSLYHELAVIGAGASLLVMSWGQPNQVGLWTYCVLWAMRWSAKLNMFLGVRNLNEEWFPDHLRYLGSYLSRRNINLLFPVSITVAALTGGAILHAIAQPGVIDGARVGGCLVFAMLLLGSLEHWFLVLPLNASALWNWAMPAPPRTEAEPKPVRFTAAV